MKLLPRTRALVLATLIGVPLSALSTSPPAFAQAPSLAGETFQANPPASGQSANIECDANTGTLTFAAQGVAAGPYPGVFEESGVVLFDPQTGIVHSVQIGFTISSSLGEVTGTKYLPPQDVTEILGGPVFVAQCFLDPTFGDPVTGSTYNFFGNTCWEATLPTAAQDAGISYETGTRNAQGTGFGEGFFSFAETILPPEVCGASPAAVTISPPAAVNPVGTQHTVTATVTDATGDALPGVTVRFRVEGSVSPTGSCMTGANGQCTFTYTGPALPGADLIVACADTDNDGVRDPGEPCGEATKAWLLPTSTPGQVTGGGHVLNPIDGEEVAFGFNAKADATRINGNCTVVDKAPIRNVKIKCLTVDSLVQSGNTATFFGQAEINGVTTNYRIDVTDNGEPGAGSDTFTIQTGSGYAAGGTLDNGNVQVHGQ